VAKPKRTRSAMKALRQSRRRQVRNKSVKTRTRGLIRSARAVIGSGQSEQIAGAVKVAAKMLDKAAGKRVIHKRAAGRYKSRLMSKAAALSKP